MTEKVLLIRAEIERLKKEWRLCDSSEAKYRMEAYKELLSFIEALPEEAVSEDLERVAQAHAVLFKSELYFSLDKEQEKLWIKDIEDTFKEGAQWDR